MADATATVILRLCFRCGHKTASYHDQCTCGEANTCSVPMICVVNKQSDVYAQALASFVGVK